MARPKKLKKKRAASPYAVFVKKHYPAAKIKFKTPQERIRHIAKLWREAKLSSAGKKTNHVAEEKVEEKQMAAETA